jgi:PKD repeat protein
MTNVDGKVFIKDESFSFTNAEIVDHNEDGKLDVCYSSKIALNSSLLTNTRPTAPPNVKVDVINNKVVVTWSRSTDMETPQKGLSYNVYIGSGTKATNVVSPLANLSTGSRFVYKIGNAGYDTCFFVINNLTAGNYTVGVQAIDNNFSGSLFRTAQFEVANYYHKTIFNNPNDRTGLSSSVVMLDANNDSKMEPCYIKRTYNFLPNDTFIGGFPSDQFFYGSSKLHYNDFNRDNKLDVFLSGKGMYISPALPTTYNANILFVSSSFVADTIRFPSYDIVSASTDIDNDGDLDMCFGNVLYKNNGNNTFSFLQTLPSSGNISFADFDSDMDIDILIGDSLFRNTGSTFQFYQKFPMAHIASAWGDIDNDGDLDIITGNELFINNGTLFTKSENYISSLIPQKIFVTDFDNNGLNDICLFSSNIIQVLYNQGDFFNPLNVTNYNANSPDIDFGDLDNDNDIDFLVISRASDSYSGLRRDDYYSNPFRANTKPQKPTGLRHKMEKLDMYLSWDNSWDAESGKNLSYNIRVGTTKNGTNIVSPLADLVTGYRKVVGLGNAQLNRGWKLKNLPVGKYYWSVQAIDQNYIGGEWSAIDSFVVTKVNPEFSADAVCLGASTTYTNTSATTDVIIRYKWIFGDGTISSLQNPIHRYASAGNFNVTLWAFTQSGDSASREHIVIVKPTPNALFAVNPVCLGETSLFINQSDTTGMQVKTWTWDFGNGKISSKRSNETNTYTKTDTATLTVVAMNGCSDTLSLPVVIAQIPTAVITADKAMTICKGDSINLSVSNNLGYAYQWRIDNVDATNGNKNTYVAKSSGVYSVKVTNTVAGCNGSGTATVTVTEKPANPIISGNNTVTICPDDNVALNIEQYSALYTYQWKRNEVPIDGETGNSLTGLLKSGVYTVEAGIQSCKALSNAVNINYKQAPAKPLIYANVGSTLYYMECSNHSAMTYKWFLNGNEITGANKYYYIAGQQLGTYMVEIAELNKECSSKSDAIAIPQVITDVAEVEPLPAMVIQPNPNDGHFLIILNGISGVKRIEIYNLQGILIYAASLQKGQSQLEVNNAGLMPGLYNVLLKTEKGTINNKIVVNF